MSDQSQESLERELTTLKIQSRSKENNWKKEKAILEQRIELQEMQIADAKSREENLRRMHETFMDALQGLSADSNKGQQQQSRAMKDLKHMLEILQVESETNKAKLQDRVVKLEKENQELRDELKEKESEQKASTNQQKVQASKATQNAQDQSDSNTGRRASSSEENKNNNQNYSQAHEINLQTQTAQLKEAIQMQARSEIKLKEDLAVKDKEITRLQLALQEAETQRTKTVDIGEHKEKQPLIEEEQQKVKANQRGANNESDQKIAETTIAATPFVPVFGIFHRQNNKPSTNNVTQNTNGNFVEEKNVRSVQQERASSSQRQNTHTSIGSPENRNTQKELFQDLSHAKQINDLSLVQQSLMVNTFVSRNGRAKTSSNSTNKGISLVILQQHQQNNPLAGQIVMRNPSKNHYNNNINPARECKSGRSAHSPEYNHPYGADSTTVAASSDKTTPCQRVDNYVSNLLQVTDHQLIDKNQQLSQNDFLSGNSKKLQKVVADNKNQNLSIQYPKKAIVSDTNTASEGRLKTQPTQRDTNPSNPPIGYNNTKASSSGVLTKLSGVLSASPRNRVAKIQSLTGQFLVGSETYSKSSSAGFQTTSRDNRSKEQSVESQVIAATKFHSPTLSQYASTPQQEQLGAQFAWQKYNSEEIHIKNQASNSKYPQPFNQQSQHLKTNLTLSSNPSNKPLAQLLSPSAASAISQQFQPSSSAQFLKFLSSQKNKENSAAAQEGISNQLDRNITGKTEDLNQQLYQWSQPRDSKGLIFPNQPSNAK